MIVAGLMSGTSLDGVDVAFVEITGKGWNARMQTLAGSSTAYPKRVREALLGISNTNTHTADIARLHWYLGEFYTDCVLALVRKTKIEPELIGTHGQTIFHEGQERRVFQRPLRSTLQIGEPSILAEHLRVPVVSDFRPRDIAAGGKGAPLAPYADYLLFRDRKQTRIALNIGGIANLTLLPANAAPEQVIAFDTGPGNMVIDQLMAHYTQGRKTYDASGAMAARGNVDTALLKRLTSDRYYRAKPPKTAGREEYGADFIATLLAANLSPEDTVATATELTARTIAIGVKLTGATPDAVFVSGGGVHNRTLMQMLALEMPQAMVTSSAMLGVDPDLKEAAFFALLAYETWHKRPGNMPSATGARHPVILGKITL